MASIINWAFNLETIQTQAELSLRRAERSPTECGVILGGESLFEKDKGTKSVP
jgi:hypothetical protein